MSITALKSPPLVHANGRRLKHGTSRFAMTQGAVSTSIRAGRKAAEAKADGDNIKRARLMLVAKANLHFSDTVAPGQFTIIDPSQLEGDARTEAEAAGFTSRTLVLHPDDTDRAIEQFSAPAKFDA